jgi:hypothetical protein
MEATMAPLKEWTQAEIDGLYATIDDLQRGGLQILTEAEVMKMCTNPLDMQKCGEFEIETLRRHPKIRRRGRARPGKGQLNFNLKPGDDR